MASNPLQSQTNQRFVAGLAELLGQFGPRDLDAHRPGLLHLLNDVIAESEARYGPLEADTPTIVMQRVAGDLASLASKRDAKA